ncbi:hypothetical protein PTKIN_Ptkin07bG0257900 [Pterospermum kingtungense]
MVQQVCLTHSITNTLGAELMPFGINVVLVVPRLYDEIIIHRLYDEFKDAIAERTRSSPMFRGYRCHGKCSKEGFEP